MEFTTAMKYFHTIILTGLMIHFFPLNAENISSTAFSELIVEKEEACSEELALLENTENTPPNSSSALIAEKEEASLPLLEEELSLLEEEFEEFKEELSSIEETIQKKEPSLPIVLEQPSLAIMPEENQMKPSMQLDAGGEISIDAFDEVAYDTALSEEQLSKDTPAILNIQGTSLMGEPSSLLKSDAIVVDLKQAFVGSPIIYSLLLTMSVFSFCIWLYSIFCMRSSARLSPTLLKNVQNKLNSNNFEEALSLCEEDSSLFCKMVLRGIHSRRHGLPVMIEAMKSEGKRSTIPFWQKIGLLNDIAIIAPMLGLLGTVMGMFYAFYDVNRSIESISTLFDGLGISVGTTVAGLIVAILALILHSTAKYRLVKALAQVENQAQSVAVLIEDRTCIYKG
jgi:biopolymer transport protein ExbB